MPNIINLALAKTGQTLVELGEKFLSQSAQLSPIQVPLAQMASFLGTKLPGVDQGLFDGFYYVIDIATWKQLIQTDWIHEKQYLTDKYDCDNFAWSFASHIPELYDISGAAVYGQAIDKNTNQLIGYHYWNAIITSEADGSKHLYFYEPQNEGMTEVLGQPVVINNWIYKPLKIDMF